MIDTTLSSDNQSITSLEELIIKMIIVEKIKSINSKIEGNKAQYDLDRLPAKISPLSSGNVSKSEFLTGKDFLPKKDLMEESVKMKRFEYSPLGKELRARDVIAKKTVSIIKRYL